MIFTELICKKYVVCGFFYTFAADNRFTPSGDEKGIG